MAARAVVVSRLVLNPSDSESFAKDGGPLLEDSDLRPGSK